MAGTMFKRLYFQTTFFKKGQNSIMVFIETCIFTKKMIFTWKYAYNEFIKVTKLKFARFFVKMAGKGVLRHSRILAHDLHLTKSIRNTSEYQFLSILMWFKLDFHPKYVLWDFKNHTSHFFAFKKKCENCRFFKIS